GYVTLVFNNHPDVPAPTMMSVIKVDCPLYQGDLKVYESPNPFEEQLVLRHNGDFGGQSDARAFQWKYLRAGFSGKPKGPKEDQLPLKWEDYQNKDLIAKDLQEVPDAGNFYRGHNGIRIRGTGQQLLPDKWFVARYFYEDPSGVCRPSVSEWTPPQLYEGWIKRVMKKINLFDQKVKDFHEADVNSLASMIALAGWLYEGAIAFASDPAYLQQLGIIEVYETLLERGKGLVGEGVDQPDLNQALLFAANRLADLYMLLGNEAFADATDPTIGFTTLEGQAGTEASSLFTFQNQVPSLLDEELALLRGLPTKGIRPFYNHLVWNFTLGEGEVAYKENYNITDQAIDQNGDGLPDDPDGQVDEKDAMVQYPQGHGDAWGHYLSAVKKYYELLKKHNFTWIPASEAILVGQAPVEVDYRDERKFAAAAAAKARTGSEIVNLTYRANYVDEPRAQWQGYRDTDGNRAWGVSGWGQRAGQGALFDWVVANAILPTHNEKQKQDQQDFEITELPQVFGLPSHFDSPDLEVKVFVDGQEGPKPSIAKREYNPEIGQTQVTLRSTEGPSPSGSTKRVVFSVPRTVPKLANITRTTVLELSEIAEHFRTVQLEIDQADMGLNPLGLTPGVLPFDIDPRRVANGETHFEQFYDRALQALNNALVVFNHANDNSNRLRRQQDTLANFQRTIENTEADFTNRLIEIYGYPYPEDCGPGKTYPSSDYCEKGPDVFHYNYVDASELMGNTTPKAHDFVVKMKTFSVDATGALETQERPVRFHMATDSRFGIIKPEDWRGRRRAPGELQFARSELLQTRGRFEKSLEEYTNLIGHIEKLAELVHAQYNLNSQEIQILTDVQHEQMDLNTAIRNSRERAVKYRTRAKIALALGNAAAEGFPKQIGIIAGMASGTISDFTASLRALAQQSGIILSEHQSRAADDEAVDELKPQQAKELVSSESNLQLTTLRGEFAVQQQLLQLENLIRTEATLRWELYNLAESLQQAGSRYLAALEKGQRLLNDRVRFRQQTAAQIQDHRYKDMAFRLFRNDALQKYRAQFDMAARYVLLAAKAYDYETTQANSRQTGGQAFLTDIVRKRTIGMIENGQPLTGVGLADPMKRMWQNFQVLKPQLGLNNPQEETNRFSLRRELFRLGMEEESNSRWQETLTGYTVDDLWNVPEFRQYARPFSPPGIPQPGLVIPFSTTISPGMNIFGQPLEGRDSYLSATNFATKIRAVGVWFSNYNNVQLSETPRVYLIPVGEDKLRTPSASSDGIRSWRVVDQKIPTPFPIVNSDLTGNPDWIPSVHTTVEEMFRVRRHSDFKAHHDSGVVKESEMTFDSRLVGRSVWNTKWLLIIPGQNLFHDPAEGLRRFIHGPLSGSGFYGGAGEEGERNKNGVSDIKLFFHTYAYSGD
ncbi:MAG: hypothetical protein KC643_22845, partial [Nitrospira sp.]|nr:hypothetical protein [Nitrospira sp.]